MNCDSHEIHLWYACDEQIRDTQLLSRYHSLLNEEESAQQKRFYFEKHRHQYLITRALVRTVLSLYVNEISPEQWQFTKNKYGKPSISNPIGTGPLHFNLSHTDKMVALAVTRSQEVGIDVEYLLRSARTVKLAESFFSPFEAEQLLALPPEKQTDRFFDLWTLKEAYIKACGMGLSIPLNHFSFSFPRQEEISISFAPERDDQPEFWQFWQIRPSDIHNVAMAIKGDKFNQSYSISMHKIIPLLDIAEVNYPIVRNTTPKLSSPED